MSFDNRRHKQTGFHEVKNFKIFKILSKSRTAPTICEKIQDLMWTQLESVSKSFQSMSRILQVDTSWPLETWWNGALPLLLKDPLISETCPLEENASRHCSVLNVKQKSDHSCWFCGTNLVFSVMLVLRCSLCSVPDRPTRKHQLVFDWNMY